MILLSYTNWLYWLHFTLMLMFKVKILLLLTAMGSEPAQITDFMFITPRLFENQVLFENSQ